MTRSLIVKMPDGKEVKYERVESIVLQEGRAKFNLPMKDTSMLAEYFNSRKRQESPG